MDFVTLVAEPRTPNGKTPARRLRREGKIPAIAYGRGLQNKALSVDPAALLKILQGPTGLNTVMRLAVQGESSDLLVMVREFTHHPVTRKFLHADFIQVKLEEEVDIEVPFILTGKPAGIVQGGVLHQIYRKLPLRSMPNSIPVQISVDITSLGLGHSLKVSDLSLPAGVRARLPQEQSIVSIVAPEKDRGAEEAAAAPGPAAAAPAAKDAKAAPAAKGAAAAPAKGGAAPAAAAAKAPAKKK